MNYEFNRTHGIKNSPSDGGTDAIVALQMRAGIVSIRDACVADVEEYIKYWCECSQRHLEFLGINREKLGGHNEVKKRFLRSIRQTSASSSSVIFTLCLNNRTIGYTNLNMYSPIDNYPHFHTYRWAVKAAARAHDRRPESATRTGYGVAAVLVGMVIKVMFDLLPIQRMVLQTRTRNLGINRALDLYLPVAKTCFFEDPDGVAGPGQFHMRYAHAEDADWMFNRARSLAHGESA